MEISEMHPNIVYRVVRGENDTFMIGDLLTIDGDNLYEIHMFSNHPLYGGIISISEIPYYQLDGVIVEVDENYYIDKTPYKKEIRKKNN